MDVNLTPGDLMTIGGASIVSGGIVQFLKHLFNLSAIWVRSLCLLIGMGVVVGTGLSTASEPFNFPTLMLLAYVGMMAGMATYAMFDTARSGFNYQASRRPSSLGTAETAVDPEDVVG